MRLYLLGLLLLAHHFSLQCMSRDAALAVVVGATRSAMEYYDIRQKIEDSNKRSEAMDAQFGYAPIMNVPTQKENILRERLRDIAAKYHDMQHTTFVPTSSGSYTYDASSKIIYMPTILYDTLLFMLYRNEHYLLSESKAYHHTSIDGMYSPLTTNSTISSLNEIKNMEDKEDIIRIDIQTDSIRITKISHSFDWPESQLHRKLALLKNKEVANNRGLMIASSASLLSSIGTHNFITSEPVATTLGTYPPVTNFVTRQLLALVSDIGFKALSRPICHMLAKLYRGYVEISTLYAIPSEPRLLHAQLMFHREDASNSDNTLDQLRNYITRKLLKKRLYDAHQAHVNPQITDEKK